MSEDREDDECESEFEHVCQYCDEQTSDAYPEVLYDDPYYDDSMARNVQICDECFEIHVTNYFVCDKCGRMISITTGTRINYVEGSHGYRCIRCDIAKEKKTDEERENKAMECSQDPRSEI